MTQEPKRYSVSWSSKEHVVVPQQSPGVVYPLPEMVSEESLFYSTKSYMAFLIIFIFFFHLRILGPFLVLPFRYIYSFVAALLSEGKIK